MNVVESLFENNVFHSWHCSMICCIVKIWPPQDLPFRKPACSFAVSGSMAAEILSRITLLKTLLVTDIRVIPLQLLHILTSPFFCNLTISPIFQSLGISSSSHIPSKMSNYQGSNYDFSSSLQHFSTHSVSSICFP